MPRIFECPKCGEDISDTYQSAEPDVGIGAGWFCDACNEGYGDEDGPDYYDDDVMISGSGRDSSHLCPCGTPYEMGYGLAGGGGIGPYMYCPRCATVSHKSTDPEML